MRKDRKAVIVILVYMNQNPRQDIQNKKPDNI